MLDWDDVKFWLKEMKDDAARLCNDTKMAVLSTWHAVIGSVKAHPVRVVLLGVLLAVSLLFASSAAAEPEHVPFTSEQRIQALLSTHLLYKENVGSCSAVAVAPGIAYTARHCLDSATGGVLVVGSTELPIKQAIPMETGPDIAILLVPGLECPCVPLLKEKQLRFHERVVLVGYPRAIGAVLLPARTLTFQTILVPDVTPEEGAAFMQVQVVGSVIGGMSGGGAFVVRDGQVYLIGTLTGGMNQPDGTSYAAISTVK